MYNMWYPSYSNWLARVVSQCTYALLGSIDMWQRGPVTSQCGASMSRLLFNHVLPARADKRCKGDYSSRRMSLHRGLGITALCSVLTWRMNTSVFRWQPPQGLQSYWRDSEGRRRTETQVKHPEIVCNLWTQSFLLGTAHDCVDINVI